MNRLLCKFTKLVFTNYYILPIKSNSLHQMNQGEDYRHHSQHHLNGNNGDVVHHSASPSSSQQQQHMDLKPTSDQLINSIGGGLSVYAGLQPGRKLPEGTVAGYGESSPGSAYSYYPSTTELAMYGGGSYPGAGRSSSASMHSRPKAKVRSNAGKTKITLSTTRWRTLTLD